MVDRRCYFSNALRLEGNCSRVGERGQVRVVEDAVFGEFAVNPTNGPSLDDDLASGQADVLVDLLPRTQPAAVSAGVTCFVRMSRSDRSLLFTTSSPGDSIVTQNRGVGADWRGGSGWKGKGEILRGWCLGLGGWVGWMDQDNSWVVLERLGTPVFLGTWSQIGKKRNSRRHRTELGVP